MQRHWPWMVAPLEQWFGAEPPSELRENPSLLLALVRARDAKLVCALQQAVVAGAGPMPLLLLPSLVGVAGSARPALLYQKEPTLAVMVAACFLGMHELVASAVGGSHECLLQRCALSLFRR
jgi:hypothetical protein